MNGDELGIKVVLDIFSGCPNPTWWLSETQVDELKAKLGAFPLAQPMTPPGLGYRGMKIINYSNITNLPERIIAYNGVLTIKEDGKINYYEDTNKIEEWLLDLARKRGYSDTIEKFRIIEE
ncbi:MAG: hypothetical protein ACE5KE_12930 [Methanosarcinales archaeon]